MDRQAWDERYRGTDLLWGAGPNRFLVEQVEGLKPGTALDVACGEGRNAIWLAERGWQVVGLDFSRVGLDKARRLAAERGVTVEWVEADVATWEPPSPYDLVVVLYLQVSPERRHQMLGRMSGWVAPGGTMLVVGHDASNLTEGHGGPQDPTVLYGPDEVVGDLGAGLEVTQAGRVDREVSTADGTAVAIDLLVRARRP